LRGLLRCCRSELAIKHGAVLNESVHRNRLSFA
jgi:hypothetical protein